VPRNRSDRDLHSLADRAEVTDKELQAIPKPARVQLSGMSKRARRLSRFIYAGNRVIQTQVLSELTSTAGKLYMDDAIVFGDIEESVRQFGITVNAAKCVLDIRSIPYSICHQLRRCAFRKREVGSS